MKKGIIFTTAIMLIVVLAVVVIGLNILNVLKITGEQTADKIFPDLGKFTPYEFKPPQGSDKTVYDSINALICGIEATAGLEDALNSYALDNDNVIEREIQKDSTYSYRKVFFDNLEWDVFWSTVCKEGVYAGAFEENIDEIKKTKEEHGTGCIDSLGVCVNEIQNFQGHLKQFDYNQGSDDKKNCPETKPFCEVICPEPFKWKQDEGDYNPEPTCTHASEISQSCQGSMETIFCMPSGYKCSYLCEPKLQNPYEKTCEQEEDKVYCTGINPSSPGDLETDLTNRILEAQYYGKLENKEDFLKFTCPDGVLFGQSCVLCQYDENKFKCTVKNFELPQPGIEDTGFLEDWIKGLGDPMYLVYYESFPKGEDSYWKPDFNSINAMALIGYAGVSSGLTFTRLGPGNEFFSSIKAAKSSGRGLGEFIAENTLGGKFAKTVGRGLNAAKNYFLKASAKNSQEAALHTFWRNGIREYLKKVFKEVGSGDPIEGIRIDEQGLFEIIIKKVTRGTKSELDILKRELKEKIQKDLQDIPTGLVSSSQIDEFVNGLTDEIVVRGLKEPLDLAKIRAIRNLGLSVDQFFTEGQMNLDLLEELLKDSSNSLESLNLVLKNNLRGPVPKQQLNRYAKVLKDATSDYPTMAEMSEVTKRQILEALDKIPGAKEAIDKAAKNMQELPQWRVNVQTATSWTKGILGQAVNPTEPLNKFLVVGTLTYFGDLIDSQNQKFYPHGVNTVFVRTPNMFDETYEFNIDNIREYSLIVGDASTSTTERLHLASPCVADITLESTNLGKKLSNKDDLLLYDLYNFGSGLVAVEKGTLKYNLNLDFYKDNLKVSDYYKEPQSGEVISYVTSDSDGIGGCCYDDSYCFDESKLTISGTENIIGKETCSIGNGICATDRSCASSQTSYSLSAFENVKISCNPEDEGRSIKLKDGSVTCVNGNWLDCQTPENANLCEPKPNQILKKLRQIDDFFKGFSGDNSVKEIFDYAYSMLNKEEYLKSLKAFMVIAEFYPDSREAAQSYPYIEAFLTDVFLISEFTPQEFREIAFEEIIPKEERARLYVPLELFECTIEEYLSNNNNCDILYESSTGDVFTEIVNPKKDTDVFTKEGNFPVDLYKSIQPSIYYVIRSQRENLFEKYFYSLHYIQTFDYTNPYHYDLRNKQPSDIKEEHEKDYPGFYSDPEVRKNYFQELVNNNFDNALYRNQQSQESSSFRNNYFFGKTFIPKYLKHMKRLLNEKIVSAYPSVVDIKKEYLPQYSLFETDETFSDDTNEELYAKKVYFEERAASPDPRFEYDNVLERWIEVSNELSKRKDFVDASYAIKDVRNSEEVALINIDDFDVISPVIKATVIKETGTGTSNYCYQVYDQTTETLRTIVTVASFFLDEVVGTAAAFACGGVPACYAGGVFATNFILGGAMHVVDERQKWPT